MSDYAAFLAAKAPSPPMRGLPSPPTINPRLAKHQAVCAEFALKAGGAGCYLDTGLGKTLVELETVAHGLLYKQLRADSTFSRQGLPEYYVVFRKWAREGEEAIPVAHTKSDFPLPQWQEWASPVWMDTRETNVLDAQRDPRDEKHICAMPLDLIERAILLWSNPGDIVLDPFGGIGSTGVVALKNGRRAVSVELKETYFRQACRSYSEAERVALSGTLFDRMEAAE